MQQDLAPLLRFYDVAAPASVAARRESAALCHLLRYQLSESLHKVVAGSGIKAPL